jgi:hypothetical protein
MPKATRLDMHARIRCLLSSFPLMTFSFHFDMLLPSLIVPTLVLSTFVAAAPSALEKKAAHGHVETGSCLFLAVQPPLPS